MGPVFQSDLRNCAVPPPVLGKAHAAAMALTRRLGREADEKTVPHEGPSKMRDRDQREGPRPRDVLDRLTTVEGAPPLLPLHCLGLTGHCAPIKPQKCLLWRLWRHTIDNRRRRGGGRPNATPPSSLPMHPRPRLPGLGVEHRRTSAIGAPSRRVLKNPHIFF